MQTLKKLLRGHWQILLLAAVLLMMAVFAARFDTSEPEILSFEISGETGTREISAWKNGDGVYYVFLPSYCAAADVRIRVNTSAPVTLGGMPLQTGQTLEDFTLGWEYELRTLLTNRKLCFLQSDNVSTLYIDTASGSMKAIHADKSNTESAGVTLLTADGTLDYSGTDCTIRGRGNSTWVYEKRPYLLNFPQTVDLLDMGAANKWVLLANATDESNLRNKLIYDAANRMDFLWSPNCEYVDLYLNGEYRGLYLLAERVEIGTSRLDIGSDPESFLCKLDLSERLASLENPFVTRLGRAVEITDPENIPTSQKSTIMERVQQMEDAIISGEDLDQVLDLDSWVRRFLIDEITENLDGDRASSYFYYQDGKFHAGPIWDYDHIWGSRDRNLNPEALLAASRYKSETKTIPYYNALYENPVFYARMVELYESELLPLMRELADTEILRLGAEISAASGMNSIRWRHMFDYWKRPDTDAAGLVEFLRRRLDFLNGVWLEGQVYYNVQVEIGDDLNYLNFTVKPGELFTGLSTVTVAGVSDPVWIDADTGLVFDGSQPITRDVRLNLVQNTSGKTIGKESLMILCYVGVIVAGTGLAAWVDCRRRKGKRRRGA